MRFTKSPFPDGLYKNQNKQLLCTDGIVTDYSGRTHSTLNFSTYSYLKLDSPPLPRDKDQGQDSLAVETTHLLSRNMCFYYDTYYSCGCFWMSVIDHCITNREGGECSKVYRYRVREFVCIDHLAGLADPPTNDHCVWLGPATPGSEQGGS